MLGTVLLLASCAGSSDSDAPYLILVSIDGFGWDFREQTDTPALDEIAARGISARALRPVFPSMTFPNHYSIATGLYPYEHGIVDNSFPDDARSAWYRLSDREAVQDGAWYRGEPIWVTAEKAGIKSAAYYFVGTEAPIAGVLPTYWRSFDADVPGGERVAQVLRWLQLPEQDRPHLVTLYFEDVDDAGHAFGPGSPEALAAIRLVDGFILMLLEGLEALALSDETYVVIVSDHGQAAHRPAGDAFVLADVIELDGLTVIDHASYASIYMDPFDSTHAVHIRDAINAAWTNGRAYLRTDAPAHWRVSDSPRFADIIVMAEPGYAVLSTADKAHLVKAGDHGWDPAMAAMGGIFLAAGPGFTPGMRIGEIAAVDVHPVLERLLELPPQGRDQGRNDSRGNALTRAVEDKAGSP